MPPLAPAAEGCKAVALSSGYRARAQFLADFRHQCHRPLYEDLSMMHSFVRVHRSRILPVPSARYTSQILKDWGGTDEGDDW